MIVTRTVETDGEIGRADDGTQVQFVFHADSRDWETIYITIGGQNEYTVPREDLLLLMDRLTQVFKEVPVK